MLTFYCLFLLLLLHVCAQYTGTELLLLGVKATPEAILGADEHEWLEKVAAQEASTAPSDKQEEAAVSKATGIGGEEIALEHW